MHLFPKVNAGVSSAEMPRKLWLYSNYMVAIILILCKQWGFKVTILKTNTSHNYMVSSIPIQYLAQ